MKAPPIIQYWHDEDVPPYITDLFATFREHQPETPHLTFNETTADAFVSRHFGAREVEAFRTCAVPAMQADYFRLCALLVLGGAWFDADTLCLASLRPFTEIEGGELFRFPDGRGVSNGFLFFKRPGHPLLRLALDIATANIEGRVSERVDMVAGPWVLTALVEAWRIGSLDGWLDVSRRIRRPPADVLERHSKVLRTTIDDAQLAKAFRDVRVSPRAKLNGFVVHPSPNLPYKDSEDHFLNFEGSIYRRARHV